MGIKARSRRTRAAATKRGKGKGNAFYSDEIYIAKKAGKSAGHPTVILKAEYPVPISDGGERDPDSSFYIYKSVRAKISTKKGDQYRNDCVGGRWPRPDNYPDGDPRVYDPEEGKVDTLWDYLFNHGDKRIGWGMSRAFNVIDLRMHHEVPKERDGKPLTYSKGDKAGEPIMARYPCEGKGCKYCDDDLEMSDGRRGYTSVGSGHFEVLGEIEEEIDDNCRSCQEGTIIRVALVCPDTGDILADLEDDADISDDQVERWIEKGMMSVNANKGRGKRVFPDELVECDTCEQGARAELTDVVLYLRKTGEGTNSKPGIKAKSGPGWVWLSDFLLSDDIPLVSDWKVIEDTIPGEDGEEDEIIGFHNEYEWNEDFVEKGWTKPFDFNNVRKVGSPAMKNEWIAEFLDVDLPPEFDDSGSNGTTSQRQSRRGGSDEEEKPSRRSSRRGNDSRRRSR